MRASHARRLATAAGCYAAVTKQQPVAARDDGQLRQRKWRGCRHALAQNLARKKNGMGEEMGTGAAIGQVGALQHRLAHLVDGALAARQAIADDVEQAGTGPVEKVAAETIAATAVQCIGRLQHGKVSGRYAQVRQADAIRAAIRIAVAHARMKVTGILALRRIVAAMGRRRCRMRERQVEQQVGRHARTVQTHVGPLQRDRGRGGSGDAAAQAVGQHQRQHQRQYRQHAAGAPPAEQRRPHGPAPAACLR